MPRFSKCTRWVRRKWAGAWRSLNPSTHPIPEQADDFMRRLAIRLDGAPCRQNGLEARVQVIKTHRDGHNPDSLVPEGGCGSIHSNGEAAHEIVGNTVLA